MTKPARILFYDIESTSLELDFGHVLAVGYKPLGGRVKVMSLLDFAEPCGDCGKVDATDDKPLMRAAHAELLKADAVVTWYGKGFDERALRTRFIDAGLPPLPDVPHIDLWATARFRLKLSSNRLASVQDFLQLKTSKTPLTKRVWRRAQAGHVPSIRYIVEHCRRDVEVLEEAYMKLRPYVKNHPRVAGMAPCRVCGGENLVRSKMRVSFLKGPREQVQCQTCGAYETRPPVRH